VNLLRAGELVLEPQQAAHAAEMFGVLSDPAIYEFENAPPSSLPWLEQRYARLETRRSADGSEQWLNWVVRLPTGELAGYVQATVMPDSSAYVAYEFASRHWRQGIGGRAVRAMLAQLVEAYGVRTFVAVLKARNHRSLALLRSLGFTAAVPPGQSAVGIDPDELALYKPASPAHAAD
jgi:RimJ/RimL family protein N-acetyltransferase